MKQLLLLAFLACTTFVYSQTNLIQNGSLENWDDMLLTPLDWTVEGNVMEENTEVSDGSSSALLINGTANPKLTATNYFLEVGKTYQLSFDYKVKTANPSFGQQVIGYAFGGSDFTPNTNANRIPQNFDWDTVTTTITPTNSENWYLEISLGSFIADAFEVYIDNIQVIQTGISPEIDALVAIYNATDGPNWTNTWDINGDMSTWFGVTLDGLGNITELNLSSNGLSGTIPSEIGDLNNLQILNLDRNQLNGQIPTSIGNLTDLQRLNLDRNQLNGQIPTEIGNLINLTRLNFFTNQLSGSIPEEIGNLTNLGELYLADNKLTGSIPNSFSNLDNLDTLLMQKNELGGDLSFLIGLNADQLSRLSLDDNNLTGEIPAAIGNLTRLFVLGLSNNQFSRTIPSEIGNLTSLSILSLNNNFLNGEIPSTIFSLTGLSRLNLSSNNFSGTLPISIGNLTQLTELDLSQNNFSGEIPTALGNSTTLFSVNLSFNQFTGTIPSQLSNSNSLRTIDIRNNKFSGEIPTEITNITDLQSFLISNNSFVFEDFENDFSTYNALPQFDYSPQSNIGITRALQVTSGGIAVLTTPETQSGNNTYQWRKDGVNLVTQTNATLSLSNITQTDLGTYDCIITNTTVSGLTIYKNDITLINPVPQSERDALVALYNATDGPNWTNTWDLNGPIGSWYGLTFNTSGYVSKINLGVNNLIGSLPNEIGNFTFLEELNLNGNQISGNIPEEIGNLVSLNKIDLSNNQLTGEIPPQIGNLNNLLDLNLGSNTLSGEIPAAIGNLNQLLTLDLNQNQLSGNINFLTSLTNLVSLDLRVNQITGEIPNEISNLSNLFFIQLFGNELSGELPEGLFSLFNLQVLSLSSNNLSGAIPSSIGNLTSLSIFNVGFNNLSGQLPVEIGNINALSIFGIENNNFSGDLPTGIKNLSNLSRLRIDNNNFVFDNLENEFGDLNTLQTFSYSPQANIGNKEAIEIILGSDLILNTTETQSVNNTYQWRKDGVPLNGENNSTLMLSNISNTDLGVYDCIITNPNVPGLILQKNSITLINPIPESEKEALIAFYNATGGPNWNTTWDLNTDPGTWHGLTFNTSGRVSVIELLSNNLIGVLPAEIGDFSELQTLSIQDNKLSGEIPAEIGNLTNLKTLFLLFNELTGTLPVEIGNLINLERISFTRNQLSGEIPVEMGNLANLERLFFNDNNFSGEIPIEITNLSNLEALSFSGNEFTGTIPSQIENLSQLNILFCSRNKFSGALPSALGNLTNLERLGLDTNEFTGTVTNALGNLSNLEVLTLNNNKLSGTFPTNIKNIAALRILSISENQFVFEDIEAEIPTLSSLSIFQYEPQENVDDSETIELIQGNTITLTVTETQSANNEYQWRKDGTFITGANQSSFVITNATSSDIGIYDCMITNPNAPDLVLQRNSITLLDAVTFAQRNALIALYNATDGPNWTNTWDLNTDISTWHGIALDGSGNVQTVILQNNNLIGTIPPEIENLANLVSLILDENQLTGQIPVEIGNLVNLESVFLDNNQLSGTIPTEIGNLTNLELLELNSNQLTGLIPIEIGGLMKLRSLRLSANELSGTIPSEIGNLINLNSLDLSVNKLSGDIPTDIGNLTNLETLRLNSNQLSDTIPSEIGNLINLRSLNLGGNELTGSIPSEIGNLTNLSSISLDNNQLSGKIPIELYSLINLNFINLHFNQLEGTISPEIENLAKLRIIALSNNQLTGTIPVSIEKLNELSFLDLIGNKLSGKIPPALGNITELSVLGISSNNFVFEDFENEFNVYNAYDIFVYSPQASVDNPEIIETVESSEIVLSVNATSSTNNSYQWQKDGVDIAGANTNPYIISKSTLNDSGVYTCVITNTVVTDLELTKEPITVTVNPDADKDGIEDVLDQCPDTPNGDIVNSNGCSNEQLNDINFNDITIVASSTSCPDVANGEITLSFEKDHNYTVSLSGNAVDRSFTDININNGLIISGLVAGVYQVCVTASDVTGFEQCYTINIEAPESLKVTETKIDSNKTATYKVSGSTNYSVTVNSKTYQFNFDTVGTQEINLDLQNGTNTIEIKTDKACQGKFSKTITNGSLVLYPIPAEKELNIAGVIENNTVVTVINTAGISVFSATINQSDTGYKIPLSDLPTGMYVVTITNPTQNINTKIFKK